jgi:hypothetical protein
VRGDDFEVKECAALSELKELRKGCGLLHSLEKFSTTYEHSIVTLGVVGTVLAAAATFTAVIVSLYLARRNETVRLKASISVSLSKTVPSVQWAAITILNVGIRVAWLPILFFEWRIPFCKKQQPETMANWINMVYSTNSQREIAVGRATIIPLADMPQFRNAMTKELEEMQKRLKWFKRTRLKRLNAKIYTDDGREFPVNFSRAMRDELRALAEKVAR